MASVELSAQVSEPDLAAALGLLTAVVAIDAWALYARKSTISRWVRHQYRHRPTVTTAVTGLLLLHLAVEASFDPLRWAAGRFDRRTA